MTVILRDGSPADAAAVGEVVAAAFGRSLEADLVKRLHDEGDVAIALVAGDAGRIIGHVLFSRMAAPFPALGLGPVSVIPERQGEGIGSRLIRAGLARAAQGEWKGVFVLGEPAYYRRFGFDAALARGFESPYAGPYLMARGLGGPLPATAGRIDYAPAFRELE